jgi:hypothetical protein
MSDDALTKVHVDLPNHGATGGESMWAEHLGGDRYRIRNVPFYAYDLNFHDVVEARAAGPDLEPSVLRVLERSGHHTLRVIFEDGVAPDDFAGYLDELRPLHVGHERAGERYYALDLEPEASMAEVRRRLDAWEADGVLAYETCEARVQGSFDEAPSEEEEEA